MGTDAVILERKILGVLIRAAREKAHCKLDTVAEQLRVTPGRLRQYELGTREISLPELESLALLFHLPLSYFLSGANTIREESPDPPTEDAVRTRRALIAAKLKQARTAAEKSPEECAQAIERTVGLYRRYELGRVDIPITELERLACFLQVGFSHFLQDGALKLKGLNVLDLEVWARLPQEVRAFVMDPTSLPYLRMAAKFRDLPKDKLKELGEILLVVR